MRALKTRDNNYNLILNESQSKVKFKKPFFKCCENIHFDFLVRVNDEKKFWWDSNILFYALFNSATIPMALAFDEFDEMFSESTVFNILDMAGNCFFILDIVL